MAQVPNNMISTILKIKKTTSTTKPTTMMKATLARYSIYFKQ
jgi:hypothetical protein